MAQEKWKQKMLDLLKIKGNESCADCGTTDPPPSFMSCNLGIFLCIDCAGLHRSLGTRFSKTKSILLDNLDEHICKEMEMKGNERGKQIYQYSIPVCWVQPSPTEHPDIREQWIRAKYERKEFVNGAEPKEYVNGAKYGWLFKKEKKGGKWNKRFFVLSSVTGLMCYFQRKEDSEPKQALHVKDLNVTMVPEELAQNKRHCMLISFPTREERPKQRHIFVYTESSFETVDWFLAMRAARFNYLKPFIDGVDKSAISNILSRKYIKMGHLHKTGSCKGDGWKKRFVCVDVNRFLYFVNPLDPVPINEVSISVGQSDEQYSNFVVEGVDGIHPKPPTNYCFMVQTFRRENKRVFNFCAPTRVEMENWIRAFKEAMREIAWLMPINDENRRMSLMSNISTISSRSDFSRLSGFSS